MNRLRIRRFVVVRLYKVCQCGEGIVGQRIILQGRLGIATEMVDTIRVLVLIIVTTETQQFPIAAIYRVIVVIAVLVVDGQVAEVLPGKLPATPRADMGKQGQRLLPIPRAAFGLLPPNLGEKGSLLFRVYVRFA